MPFFFIRPPHNVQCCSFFSFPPISSQMMSDDDVGDDYNAVLRLITSHSNSICMQSARSLFTRGLQQRAFVNSQRKEMSTQSLANTSFFHPHDAERRQKQLIEKSNSSPLHQKNNGKVHFVFIEGVAATGDTHKYFHSSGILFQTPSP